MATFKLLNLSLLPRAYISTPTIARIVFCPSYHSPAPLLQPLNMFHKCSHGHLRVPSGGGAYERMLVFEPFIRLEKIINSRSGDPQSRKNSETYSSRSSSSARSSGKIQKVEGVDISSSLDCSASVGSSALDDRIFSSSILTGKSFG